MAQDPNAEDLNENKNDENKVEESKKFTSAEILVIREQWESIKKSLDAVMPIVDQIIRLETAGNKPNKLKNTKKKKIKQLKDFKTKLSKLPKDDQHVVTGTEIAKNLSQDLSAEQLGNFNFEIRRFTQSIVKIRRDLMQEYKKVKKEEQQNDPTNDDNVEDNNDNET
eukprot:237740_1